jgi:hypothetical protein
MLVAIVQLSKPRGGGFSLRFELLCLPCFQLLAMVHGVGCRLGLGGIPLTLSDWRA